MKAFLIAEEGNLIGTILPLEGAEEWVIGRDRNACQLVLEDPMVSRKAAMISFVNGEFILENLSATNPINVNGENVIDPTVLGEGDMVQIGSTSFRFSFSHKEAEDDYEEDKEEESPIKEREEEEYEIGTLSFAPNIETRWMIKVVSGPNNGAQFGIKEGETYVLGKDPDHCDILFQDLSVSRQHARLSCSSEGEVFVEDLGSRNGVLLNGSLIEGKTKVESQDLLAMGTSSLLLIDREVSRQTIYSPPIMTRYADHPLSDKEKEEAKKKALALEEEIKEKRNWKETFIPVKHLAFGALIVLVVVSGFIGAFSLFRTIPIEMEHLDETAEVRKVLKHFPSLEFSFTPGSGKLFLMGHLLTNVEYEELLYLLKSKPFIKTIDDNVIIDEYVFENMNALLFQNPDWRSCILTAGKPGEFILKGYVQTLESLSLLNDYVNRNFPYLDKLKMEVIVENNIETNIQSMLTQKGFNNVAFQFGNGEIVFSGKIEQGQEKIYNTLLKEIDQLPGVRHVKNFVVYTSNSSARLDISNRYKVTGTSKIGELNQFVLINGKILSMGDTIDGMVISHINPSSIFLEKEGVKYKIDYNLQ